MKIKKSDLKEIIREVILEETWGSAGGFKYRMINQGSSSEKYQLQKTGKAWPKWDSILKKLGGTKYLNPSAPPLDDAQAEMVVTIYTD